MLDTQAGSVEVIQELNPYKKKANSPLLFELTSPNVFLRTAHGNYIDYLRSITTKHSDL